MKGTSNILFKPKLHIYKLSVNPSIFAKIIIGADSQPDNRTEQPKA